MSQRSAPAPSSTASADDRTSAPEEAAKTSHLFCSPSEAISIVASCVLSPSSAKKTEKNMVKKLVSIVIIANCQNPKVLKVPPLVIHHAIKTISTVCARITDRHDPVGAVAALLDHERNLIAICET